MGKYAYTGLITNMKKRIYSDDDVIKLKGTVHIDHTLARLGARKLRELLDQEDYVQAFGAYNGQQAVQQVKAGLKAIYVSGWQVAAAANSTDEVYPDQSLYAVDSVPNVVRNINNAFRRQDQITFSESSTGFPFAPIVADAEAGFGGALNSYELARNLIEAGAAAVHFEDQLASEKKCGHLGGKVLIPTSQAIRNLNAARLASDVAGTDTVVIARTDAESAKLLSNDVDDLDKKFCNGKRTAEGFYEINGGLEYCVERGQAYSEYADLIWCETSKPCLKEAKYWADGVRAANPNAMLAYNCSPSFRWKEHLGHTEQLTFQKDLAKLGFKFQFITLAGFHATNYAVFDFADRYKRFGMKAFAELQEKEILAREHGFTSSKHQREVGVGYFDAISQALGNDSVTAMADSTEQEQF